jgi:hypothetical protein
MFRIGWVGRPAILIAKILYSKCKLVLERKRLKLSRFGVFE